MDLPAGGEPTGRRAHVAISGLSPAGSRGQRPDHQALACEPQPQAWLQGGTPMETRKRLAKIVLVFVGLFALCWFPNHVLYMYRSFHYHQMDLSLAHLVITLLARVLSFSSSCVNPFALYLLSESFRRHFNSQLRCVRDPRPERQASYLHSTSHIRLTSIKKTTPTAAIIAPAANGNSSRQEVAL
ncbi:hypothetical protein L3Q82_001513 [Scortum barcoo]|uniref:Uncharacterized protein n=1 Tax=Scortum barcoo TaxID=214431 RepID=A0ACB8W861_9TELE|nr:hypothetical protein L3Q82_001513 [Scortum barcoo]